VAEDDQGSRIPAGRVSRFARLASLTARTASDLAIGKARRALGDESFSQEQAAAKKVLETLGTMKGAAMKLGQQLAMEGDALPPEAQAIVAKLFAQAPSMSYDDIAKVILEELGDPPDEVFAEFDHTPLASASLGQVHKAKLKDGTVVAVKVQYPGVAEALLNDLKNAGLLVKTFGGAGKALSSLDAGPYYEEIRREVGAETDYVREGRMADEFRMAVADIPELHVPRVYPAYSTGRVLTADFVEGLPLHKYAATDASPEDRWRVGSQLVTAILSPFLRYRFIHGDPHPGNFLVRPDGRLTILDFGAVKKLSPEFSGAFRDMFDAALYDRTPDLLAVLKGANFVFKGDLGIASKRLLQIHQIVERPLKQEEYDWGDDKIVNDIRALFMSDFREIFDVQAPAECIFFYRAVGGIAHNLRALKAKGPYRAHCRALLKLPVGAAAA
jgi:predicted unusual protein kinase regulating ubiquinone biosynthesis (AarF/ABC1/UbiB family)